MADRTREAGKPHRSTTVLDPLRPAVVVRRRVYDAALLESDAAAPRAFTSPTSFADDEESGPPSSINVARALASLRSDELQRVEELVRADEDAGADDPRDGARDREDTGADVEASWGAERCEASDETPVPARSTLTLGRSIALSDLARRMGLSAQELPATLVALGFYALDANTVLPRETARVIAEMYGWRVENVPLELDESTPIKSGTRSRISTKRAVGRRTSKANVTVKVKRASTKPTKRRLAR